MSSSKKGRGKARTELRFDTMVAHAGQFTGTLAGAHPTVPPVVHASSYWYDSSEALDRVLGGEVPGYVYGRFASPTVEAFEQAVAALEGAAGAVAFGSGMAAIHATLLARVPRSSMPIFASSDCYGGTYTLLANVFAELGTRVHFVDVFNLVELERRLGDEKPRALVIEVLANPLARVAPLIEIGELCRRYGTTLVVDSSFTSPFLVRPLQHAATYVVHSATKYLGGHGDVTAGVTACATPELATELRTLRTLTGSTLGPQEAFLALRGLRTLSLRMERQCANAMAVARFLAEHPRVERVHYPGLSDSPAHAAAVRLFPDGMFGGMLAFAVGGAERDDIMRLMERLQVIRAAPTMGDLYSLVLYPVIASHRGLTPEQRRARGIHDNVLRFSAGIEDPADLITDLDRALSV